MLYLNTIDKKAHAAYYTYCLALIFFLACFFLKPGLALAQVPPAPVSYPKVTAYVGILHPVITISQSGTTTNFNDYYAAGMPTGINIWKSAKIGYSLEIVPLIRVEDGISKTNNLLFHPGLLVALGNGFTFAGRAAFETSGRYGLTPIFSKSIFRNENSSFYISLPLPVRLGNDQPASATSGFVFGMAF